MLDFRSDQFSLGVVLYEMATGVRAFQRGSLVDTISAILNHETPSLAKVRPDLPAPLRWVVERCLAKDPDDRFGCTRRTWPASCPVSTTSSTSRHRSQSARPRVGPGWRVSPAWRCWRRSCRDPIRGRPLLLRRPCDSTSTRRRRLHSTSTARHRPPRPSLRTGSTLRVRRSGRRREEPPVGSPPGRLRGPSASGYRWRHLSVLVSRQPAHRVLCGGQAEEGSPMPRTSRAPSRCT